MLTLEIPSYLFTSQLTPKLLHVATLVMLKKQSLSIQQVQAYLLQDYSNLKPKLSTHAIFVVAGFLTLCQLAQKTEHVQVGVGTTLYRTVFL